MAAYTSGDYTAAMVDSGLLGNVTANETYNGTYRHHVDTGASNIQTYSMPVICVLGLTGNTLAAITFLQKSLRSKSSCIYLAARSISDNGFLSTLLLIWMSSTFDLRLSTVPGLCKVLLFLTYVCGCLSVWLVVFVSIETYISICRPFIVKRICTTGTACFLVGALFLLTLCVYHVPLWISNSDCSPSNKYYDVTQAFIYTDTFLTLVAPSLIIAGLMLAICCTVIRNYNQRRKNDRRRHKSPMANVTRMLLAVSLIFFFLNLPSHVIRLRLLIVSFVAGYNEAPRTEAYIQTVSLQVYYISLAVNIFVYLGFGTQFRREFLQLFGAIRLRIPSRWQTTHQRLNTQIAQKGSAETAEEYMYIDQTETVV